MTTNDGSKLDLELFHVGKQLELYPWHSCATASMHGTYYAYDGDRYTGEYTILKPCRGW